MNASETIARIESLLSRKQTVPTQMIRDLLIDCKAQKALNNVLKAKIAELEMKPEAEQKAEAS